MVYKNGHFSTRVHWVFHKIGLTYPFTFSAVREAIITGKLHLKVRGYGQTTHNQLCDLLAIPAYKIHKKKFHKTCPHCGFKLN